MWNWQIVLAFKPLQKTIGEEQNSKETVEPISKAEINMPYLLLSSLKAINTALFAALDQSHCVSRHEREFFCLFVF